MHIQGVALYGKCIHLNVIDSISYEYSFFLQVVFKTPGTDVFRQG